jgi:hypothetical protein
VTVASSWLSFFSNPTAASPKLKGDVELPVYRCRLDRDRDVVIIRRSSVRSVLDRCEQTDPESDGHIERIEVATAEDRKARIEPGVVLLDGAVDGFVSRHIEMHLFAFLELRCKG